MDNLDNALQQATKTTLKDFEDLPKATHCNHCKKPLEATAVHCIGGKGFCNHNCLERAYYISSNQRVFDEVYASTILSEYADTDLSRMAVNKDKIDHVLAWRRNPKGFILHGSTGAGKTRILTLLLKKLIKEDFAGVAYSMKVFWSGKLSQALANSYGNKNGYARLMEELSSVKLLVIDDFGKEKFTEFYESSLFNIVEARTSNRLPTLWTTNFSGDKLKQRFTDGDNAEPFLRRLREYHEAINLKQL